MQWGACSEARQRGRGARRGKLRREILRGNEKRMRRERWRGRQQSVCRRRTARPRWREDASSAPRQRRRRRWRRNSLRHLRRRSASRRAGRIVALMRIGSLTHTPSTLFSWKMSLMVALIARSCEAQCGFSDYILVF
jgi:hypothetical protein